MLILKNKNLKNKNSIFKKIGQFGPAVSPAIANIYTGIYMSKEKALL